MSISDNATDSAYVWASKHEDYIHPSHCMFIDHVVTADEVQEWLEEVPALAPLERTRFGGEDDGAALNVPKGEQQRGAEEACAVLEEMHGLASVYGTPRRLWIQATSHQSGASVGEEQDAGTEAGAVMAHSERETGNCLVLVGIQFSNRNGAVRGKEGLEQAGSWRRFCSYNPW